MQVVNLQQFQYTLLEEQMDVTQLKLRGNLFGINNRIYANLASVNMTDKDKDEYSKHFTDEELQYPILNRLFQIHISCRKHNDEYETIESIDFQQLYDKVKKDHHKYDRIYAGYNDSGNVTDKELGVLFLPLNSKVLRDGCNYAYQQFERIKMDCLMDITDATHVRNFLNVF